MASLQQARSSSEVHPKHHHDLHQLMKQAHNARQQKGVYAVAQCAGSQQVVTSVAMLNNAKGTLVLHDYHDWLGSVFGSIPPSIAKGASVTLTHKGDNGSKGAVIYKGPNTEGGPDNCAWVLAWSALGDGSKNKVYVETGPIQSYPSGGVHWDDIKTKLGSSSNESHYVDTSNTKAEASAKIDETGNNPNVCAVFDVAPV